MREYYILDSGDDELVDRDAGSSKKDTVIVEFPRKGYWSGNNTFGNIVRYEETPNNRQTILKLSEDGYPQVWSVSLGTNNAKSDLSNYSINAEIVFGCGGSSQTVFVDWHNGNSLSLVANAIEIIAFYSPAFFGPGFGVPDNLELSAQVAKGTIAKRDRTTFTETSFFDGSGASVVVEVPPFATEFVIMSTDLSITTAAGFLVDFMPTGNGTGTVIGSIIGTQFPPVGSYVPIMHGTRSLLLTPPAGPIIFKTKTIFGLSL